MGALPHPAASADTHPSGSPTNTHVPFCQGALRSSAAPRRDPPPMTTHGCAPKPFSPIHAHQQDIDTESRLGLWLTAATVCLVGLLLWLVADLAYANDENKNPPPSTTIASLSTTTTSQSLPLIATPYPKSAYSLGQFYALTRDDQVVEALLILEMIGETETVKTLMDRQVHVVFKNLEELGRQYRNADALSWLLPNGEQMIFIDEIHKFAPPQAIAAIISHELMHNDVQNSIQEEITAWNEELRVWKAMKTAFPILNEIKVKQFPLVDRLNAIGVLEQKQQLTSTIANHKGYRGLPKTSPGFE